MRPPGVAVGGRAGQGGDRLGEGPLREAGDDFDGRVGALALLDHVVPLAALGVGEHLGVAGEQLREEAQAVGVVGHHQEIERPGQPRGSPIEADDLLPLGEAVGVLRAEAAAEGPRVHRRRRVQVRVAEQRPRRVIAARVGRVRLLERLVGRLLVERADVRDGGGLLAPTTARTIRPTDASPDEILASREVFMGRPFGINGHFRGSRPHSSYSQGDGNLRSRRVARSPDRATSGRLGVLNRLESSSRSSRFSS